MVRSTTIPMEGMAHKAISRGEAKPSSWRGALSSTLALIKELHSPEGINWIPLSHHLFITANKGGQA